jgi:FlaA1/EpsC-like NDP-sugar epimerase
VETTVTIDGKRILVTGGTGSLGKRVVRRLLDGVLGRPGLVTVLSRDEAKQHEMRLQFLEQRTATDDVIYAHARDLLRFRIGDVRDEATLREAVRNTHIVIHAAALKQVPTCEYFPLEAVRTNIMGADALVRATIAASGMVETVVGISTDKACKPINVMGMTKALMERVLVEANLREPRTRFVCVRYGNVVASRGSVVPLFLDQIAHGGPLTITTKEMTRFLLTLDRAVDTVFAALANARPGEIYVPRVPAARMVDVASALIDGRNIPIVYSGIRPGEKVHEIMVSEEERHRTLERDGYYVICPMLPECGPESVDSNALLGEYSSSDITLDEAGLRALLEPYAARSLTADLSA